jgi:tellurite resistance protein TehA-like permease
MGLSVTASLLGVHVSTGVGTAVTAVAAVVFISLVTGTVRAPMFDDVPAWSMMTMGVLALGSAADTNLGWAGTHAATWMIGSAAALVVFAVQCTRLVRRKVSAVFPGVLPLVTPMVAATNAAQLGHPLPGSVFFFASLLTALPAFARVYNSAGRRPAGGLAATAWIPLGVVGQSSAAALLLTDGRTVGVVYAVAILCLGVPAGIWAIVNHWGALRHLPAANPSWWAATFPVGTCSLGTHTLAAATGEGWIDVVSAVLLVLLCIHVVAATAGVAFRLVLQ